MTAAPALVGRRRVVLACSFALASVRSNARRVALAVLGVAIGIAAVTSMLAVGHSVAAQSGRVLDRLGGDFVVLSITPQGAEDAALDNDASALMAERERVAMARAERVLRAMREVAAVAPVTRLAPCAEREGDPMADLDLLSTTPGLRDALSLRLAQGRFLHEVDGAQGWVVLGAEAAQAMARRMPTLRPGASIEVCGRTLRVAGILAPRKGEDLLPMVGVNRALIVLPLLAARLGTLPAPSQLMLRVRDASGAADAGETLALRLSALSGDVIKAQSARQFTEMRREQVALHTRFLVVLGFVSLLVGSLGITNVMLVSVAERRTEIGLRAAVGAHPADIALQFIVESTLICLLGAVLGMVLGLAGAFAALALAGIDFSLSPAVLLAALLLALVAGLVAGACPAWRAARLDPVSTLQGG